MEVVVGAGGGGDGGVCGLGEGERKSDFHGKKWEKASLLSRQALNRQLVNELMNEQIHSSNVH